MNPELISVAQIPEKKNFDFVDTIRCISMVGIVFEHCTVVGDPDYVSVYSGLFQASVMQFFKFATIAFFLIAGFLINHKFTEYTPLQYIKNRFKSTIGPWAFWLHVLLLFNVGGLFYKYLIIYKGDYPMPANFWVYLGDEYYRILVFSSFWFILNFLICICILLIFKRYIYKIWFGVALGLVSLFYSFNLYYGWIITTHTTALFGYVFYLWLGAYINNNYAIVKSFIERTRILWFIGLTVFFFLLADGEAVNLKQIGIKDAYNTLRITNILYSICFFFLLLKIGPIDFINKKLEPRNTTYGIYLIHQIIINQLLVELFRPLKLNMDALTLVAATGYTMVRFLFTYSLSLLLVMLIKNTKFRWSIGVSAPLTAKTR